MTLDGAKKVLAVEAEALLRLRESLDNSFIKLVDAILSCKGRVVVTGMGKSGLVGQKISATLASTGTPSFALHPADALHGDLGMVTGEDVVFALSNSGETEELVALAPILKRMGAFLATATGNPKSTLARTCDLHITVAIDQEACPLGLAPMASTTAQMALGDALAAALIERRGFKPEDFARLHPGGKLGKRLMRVHELMHTGAAMPRVSPDTLMKDVLYEISAKKLGHAVVVDAKGKVTRHHHGRRHAPPHRKARRRPPRHDGGGLRPPGPAGHRSRRHGRGSPRPHGEPQDHLPRRPGRGEQPHRRAPPARPVGTSNDLRSFEL